MQTEILTNRINLHIDHDRLDSKFDVWLVTTDLTRKVHYGVVINAIYNHMKPLSLAFVRKGLYAVMLPKGASFVFNNSHYAVRYTKSRDLPIITCGRLLIGAVPHLSVNPHRYAEGAGLYYLVDIEKICGVEVLRTFEIKILKSCTDILLNVSAATFTPAQYHTNAAGELYGDCKHLPRFKFDHWTHELTRNKTGEYIKKKHRDRKMKSEMVSLDTKNPSKFSKSKMGVLAQFTQDVEMELGDILKISFISLESSYRLRFQDSNIEATYKQIDSILSAYSVNIVNLTRTNTAPLEERLQDDGITYQATEVLSPSSLNLVIHHPSDVYADQEQDDPYRLLHRERKTVVQSVYPETLFTENALARSQYEACKKELMIKLEVNLGALLLIPVGGHWEFIIGKNIGEVDKAASYHVLTIDQGFMSYRSLWESEAEEILIGLPGILLNGDHAIVDRLTGDSFIIKETGMVALPQFRALSDIMKQLQVSYDSGLPREWVCEFLDLVDSGNVQIKNSLMVTEKLEKLLAATVGKKNITKEVLLTNIMTKIAYRGSFQTFFDWVAVNKGMRFAASLKSQRSGFIESSLGLFYNENERLYYVGDNNNVKSVPRFCRIRHIFTDAVTVPEDLFKMMEVFHVRHRQATVLPFPFKHLSEYIRRADLSL